MATALYIWTALGILIGAAAVLPLIMGLFGRNKFDVNGKVILLTNPKPASSNISRPSS